MHCIVPLIHEPPSSFCLHACWNARNSTRNSCHFSSSKAAFNWREKVSTFSCSKKGLISAPLMLWIHFHLCEFFPCTFYGCGNNTAAALNCSKCVYFASWDIYCLNMKTLKRRHFQFIMPRNETLSSCFYVCLSSSFLPADQNFDALMRGAAFLVQRPIPQIVLMLFCIFKYSSSYTPRSPICTALWFWLIKIQSIRYPLFIYDSLSR